jgi:hypothetical protein
MTTSLTQLQHFSGPLAASRDGIAEQSAVLASCDPRTPDTLTVHLATMWTTTTLSLPELERLLRLPSRRVVVSGEPGRGAVYLPTEHARRLCDWLRRVDAERTHPPRNRLT